MKYWPAGIGALALAVTAGFLLSRRKQKSTDEIDGGVRHFVDTKAPKKIESTEITFFHCRFSTTDLCPEDSPIADYIVTLRAFADGGYCQLRGRSESEKHFFPSEDFFRQLQQIVSDYQFARYNGTHYTVSGVPPNIGMELEVHYASGEYIRASNNQSCFLPLKAMEELVALFQKQ